MLNLWLKHGHLDTLAYILIPQAPIQPSRFPAWLVRFRAVHLVQLSLYWQTQSIIQAWGTLFTADPSIFYVSKATSPWVTSIHGNLFYGSIFSQQWSHTWTQGVKKGCYTSSLNWNWATPGCPWGWLLWEQCTTLTWHLGRSKAWIQTFSLLQTQKASQTFDCTLLLFCLHRLTSKGSFISSLPWGVWT